MPVAVTVAPGSAAPVSVLTGTSSEPLIGGVMTLSSVTLWAPLTPVQVTEDTVR